MPVKAGPQPPHYGSPRQLLLPGCAMYSPPTPDWILIANATRARVLQQEPGSPMVVLESFVHPVGRGARSDGPSDPRQKEGRLFAHELAQYLEREARQARFGRLTVFAASPFAEELRAGLGKLTRQLLTGVHELDLTSVGMAELERRVFQEMAAH
jgi:protein required for attachment to host cells